VLCEEGVEMGRRGRGGKDGRSDGGAAVVYQTL
jgi:hypothetical protein